MNFSKTVIALLFFLPALLTVRGQGNDIRRYDATSRGEVSFVITHTKQPIFPFRLRNEGYSEGYATFAVFVDQFGNLKDHLLIEASHIEFGDSVDRVLPEWEYSVPIVDGESSSIVSTVKVSFQRGGTIVYESIGLFFASQMYLQGSKAPEYRIHSIRELDAIPEPIHIVRPDFHLELLEERDIIRAVFEFYIDNEGSVRMPTLREADDKIDERLLIIAQESILQWKFNAPKINGRPVVTKAAQPFRFRRGKGANE